MTTQHLENGREWVSLEDVVVRLAGRTLLDGATFTLRAGESWALVGPNGAGKSSLLRLIRGELWPFPTGRRVYALDGAPQESPIGVRERIGIVSAERQDEFTRRDWDLRAEHVVLGGFTDSVYPQERATPAQDTRIRAQLDALGVGHLRRRPMLELSTGEARRVLLARALVTDPRILLLDEACNGLDADAQRTFLGHVEEVIRRGTSVLMATHRPDEIVQSIRNVAMMERGRVVRTGGRELLEPAAGCARASGRATNLTRAEARDEITDPLVRLDRVSVHHEDGTPALFDVDWTWREGESWAVLGANGAGKSTLLKLVAGELQPMPGGRISRRGFGPHADRWEIATAVALVSPELQARHRLNFLAEDVVLSGFRDSIGFDGEPTDEESGAARDAMSRLGVAALEGRRIHALSYGELRRLLIARALVSRPRLLLLDEPFSSLDAPSRAALAEDLEALARGGVHLLVATHHPDELGPAVNRVLRLREGRVAQAGPRP
ncbi:MAG TPA: ATP-binding cassette domain-containing protein [Anaeromyxobacteraceae bacterium]|nr:ATP-binding cassette domain-containing protein [Anaeromyxobacteraceae bacterium]